MTLQPKPESELLKLGNEWESALRRTPASPRARVRPRQQGDSQAPRESSCHACAMPVPKEHAMPVPQAAPAVVTSRAEAEGQKHQCSEQSKKRHVAVQVTLLPKQ